MQNVNHERALKLQLGFLEVRGHFRDLSLLQLEGLRCQNLEARATASD